MNHKTRDNGEAYNEENYSEFHFFFFCYRFLTSEKSAKVTTIMMQRKQQIDYLYYSQRYLDQEATMCACL